METKRKETKENMNVDDVTEQGRHEQVYVFGAKI
jgi:hypothetical protein